MKLWFEKSLFNSIQLVLKARVIFPSRVILSGNIFARLYLSGWWYGIWETFLAIVRNAAQHPKMHRTIPHDKELSSS